MLSRFSITKILIGCMFLLMTLSCSIQGRDVSEHREFDPAGITAISVEGVSLDVSLSVVPGNKIKVHLTGTTTANQVLFSTDQESGTLRIICDDNTVFSSNLKLAVELPDDKLSAVDIKTVSGDIHISDIGNSTFPSVITLGTISGSIKADRIEGETKSTSVSGDISIEYGTAAYKTDAGNTSGDIQIRILDGSSFSFSMETVSGDRTCDFPYSGGTIDSGSTGSGGPHLFLETVSGSIGINKI